MWDWVIQSHSDSRMRINFRSKLGNQKLRFDRPDSRYSVSKGRYPVEGRACRPTLIPCRSTINSRGRSSWNQARQSRFQMDDNGDLHEQILHVEARIEELADIIETCRKIIFISKVAIAAGGILILATIIGAVGFDPTVLIGAMAAVIGGTVVFGSNTSTLKQTMTDMKAAEAHRTELISRMDLKVVADGEVERIQPD
jgi:hypothetical protein